MKLNEKFSQVTRVSSGVIRPVKIYLAIAQALAVLILLPVSVNAQMFWGHAGNFLGNANSYAVIPNSSSINITGSFTVEAWVYPTTASGIRYIVFKGSAGAGYYLRLNTTGTVSLGTNGINRVTSTAVVPAGKWSHIAGTYNTTNNEFSIFVNGFWDGFMFPNNPPSSTTDSLLIGKFGANSFTGLIDEVRIWNRALPELTINRNMRTSLGATGGAYSGLVLALTFQDENSNGTVFNFTDWSGSGNNAINRGVLARNLSNAPSNHLSLNESLDLDDGYFAVPNHSSFNLSGIATVEAWAYMTGFTSGQGQTILSKGTVSNGYSFYISLGGELGYRINNTSTATSFTMPVGRWVHMAMTIDAANLVRFYVNGSQITSATRTTLIANTDSLFIGKFFNGYIDEVRIAQIVKTPAQIQEFLYKSVDAANDLPGTDIVWNFDGLARDNGNHGTRGYFRGFARFSNPATQNNVPVSPLVRADNINFSNGFNIRTSNRRIPESGTIGNMVDDSLVITGYPTINDINLFVGINHTFASDMKILLIAPNGDSVLVCANYSSASPIGNDKIITIFDDNADSTLSNSRYTDISTRIKPQNNMNSVFNGDNPNGVWRLRIRDEFTPDAGRLYAWGIQINNSPMVGIQNVSNEIPNRFELSQNYPNPFNPKTNFELRIADLGFVSVKVYDISGKQVAVLVNESLSAGIYNVDFDASHLSSGVYFYRLETNNFSQTRKMMLVK